MKICKSCPRCCKVDRINTLGFCQKGREIEVAKIIEDFCYEEPCLSKKGLVAIFFAGCNLRCEYCQNIEISRQFKGKVYSNLEFAKLLKSYDEKEIEGFDFITPTPYSENLLEVFKIYKPKHKIIYNTSGFENLQTFKKLCKYIDILLTDFKYFDDNLAIKYSNAPNYRSVTIKVIKEYDKYKQTKVKDGILLEGRIIRHLVLPSLITDSFKVLDEIAKLGKNHIVSIMSQFTPLQNSLLNRKITALEYKAVIAHARKLGLNFGYLQDFESADEIFIPKF